MVAFGKTVTVEILRLCLRMTSRWQSYMTEFESQVVFMGNIEQELQEMLEIGRYLGHGPRYLLCYYGRLAITNDTGVMRWPKGPKVIVAVIKARECASGLSPARKEFLLTKLRSFEGVREEQCRQAKEDRRLLCLQRI